MASTCAIGRLLEAQIPGLRASHFGGEELTRAAAALDNGAGPPRSSSSSLSAGDADAGAGPARQPGSPRSPRAPLAPPPLPSTLPPRARQLLESPALRSLSADARTRELACAVSRHAAAAADEPLDAEAQFQLALALQELSLRPGIGRGLGDEDEDDGGWGVVGGAAAAAAGAGAGGERGLERAGEEDGDQQQQQQQQDEAASVVLLRAACGAYAVAERVLARQRRRQRWEQQQKQQQEQGLRDSDGQADAAADLAAAMLAAAARSARAELNPLRVTGGPRLQSVHYNWGVALSTLASALRRRDPAEARCCLERASGRYAAALRDGPANPQALNNWALVLQELAQQQQQPQEQRGFVRGALDKFRLALRARPDFDRGCYNMGTIYYTLACAQQQQQQQSQQQQQQQRRRDAALRALFAAAGQYICLAHALQPDREVYRRSLGVVRQMLPLPFLRAGYLGVAATAAHPSPSPHHRGRRCWFVLDHASLRAAGGSAEDGGDDDDGGSDGGLSFPGAAGAAAGELSVALRDVRGAWRCAEPSLPPGEALWVGLIGGESGGLYLLAADADEADAWVDALMLVSHLARSGQSGQLAAALSVGWAGR